MESFPLKSTLRSTVSIVLTLKPKGRCTVDARVTRSYSESSYRQTAPAICVNQIKKKNTRKNISVTIAIHCSLLRAEGGKKLKES